MKRIVLIIVFALLVIALTPYFVEVRGYVLIAIGDLNIEFSVFAGIVMLTIFIFALFFVLKVFKGGLNLSFGAWNKIAYASRRRGIRNFNKGIACYVLGDYKQAEHLLVKSAEPSQSENTAYLLAASAADKQSLHANTKHYLTQIDDSATTVKELGLDSILVRLQLHLSQKEYANGRKLIDEYHKHIGHDARLLSLEIDLCLIEARYQTAIDYLPAARKQKAIDSQKIEHWETTAFTHQFSDLVTNKDQKHLTEYWQNLPRKIKQREPVLLAYCNVLAQNQIMEPLTDILLPMLKKDVSDTFLKNIRCLPIQKTDELITIVQKHLQKVPISAKWLSTLGYLAYTGKQYSLAEKSYNSLTNLEGERYDEVDLASFAKTLSAQENYKAANQLYANIVSRRMSDN